MKTESPFTSTKATLSALSYRKPANVHLNAHASIATRRGKSQCPFYGDRDKGCRCREAISPHARQLLKAYNKAFYSQWLCGRKLTFRDYAKRNKRVHIHAMGIDYKQASDYLKAHALRDVTAQLQAFNSPVPFLAPLMAYMYVKAHA